MAEEGLSVAVDTATANPTPLDLKRKLGDLVAEEPPAENDEPSESNGGDLDSAESDEADVKRPRPDDKPKEASAGENGHEEKNAEESTDKSDDQPLPDEVSIKVTEEALATDAEQSDDNVEQANQQEPSQDVPSGEDQSSQKEQDTSESGIITRRMEIPNNKVGVLIGKSGDTIRYLQNSSGAKIQITKDVDTDPQLMNRPVEMVGSLDSVKKAEKLISAVIAEAEAGGSPSLISRGLGLAQAATEKIEIQVPNDKVGVIIGKGGETIKGLQTRSGARIQLIPQHLPEGDESKERTVRVTGDRRQIETAREMLKMRLSSHSGGHNQQGYRPRGPPRLQQWGPRGHHHMGHMSSYDYPQRGPYSPQNQQYPPHGYPQGSRSGYNSGSWDQRPTPPMHQHGYDYYGGQKGHFPEPGNPQHSAPPHAHHPPGPSPNPAMGPPPPHSQQSYSYGQHQAPDYGNSAPYPQSSTHHQPPYGQGYEDHGPPPQQQHHYGGPQPYAHTGGPPTGYAPPQQQYGKPPPYGMQSQAGPSLQPYCPPRPNQPTDASYQGVAAQQPYGQGVPPQQQYSYAPAPAPVQQQQPAYAPPYGSTPVQPASADGYSQVPPQQGGQPVASYGSSGAYGQVGPTAAYGQYPPQQGYADQSAASYGYQSTQDLSAAYGAAPAAATPAGYGAVSAAGQQTVYTAQATTQAHQQGQPGGQQQQAGTYGGNTVSPQPQPQPQPQPGYAQYDSTQMYAAQH